MIAKVKKLLIDSKGHIYSQIANIVFMFAGMIQHILLNKYILVNGHDYGIYSTILSVMGTCALLFTTGFPLYLTRKIARKEVSKSDILAIAFLDIFLATMIGIGIYFFREPLSGVLFKNYPVSEHLKIFFVLITSYTISGLIQSFYQGNKLFKEQALIGSLVTIVKATAAVIFGYYFGVTGALLSYALPGYLVLLYFIVRYKENLRGSFYGIWKSFHSLFNNKLLWTFVIVTTLYSVINNFLTTRELLLVENILPGVLSDYSFIVMIGRLPIYPLATLALVFFPNYSRKEITNQELQRRLVRDTLFEIGISIPVLLGYLFFGEFVIRIISRVTLLNSSFVLFLVGCSSVSFAIFTLLCTKLQGFGKEKETLVAIIFSVIIQALVGPYLISVFGVYGAAVTIFVATAPVGLVLFTHVLNLLRKESPSEVEVIENIPG